MPFTLSYLRTTGASKTERELLVQTNAFYKQRFSNKTVLHVASSTFFYITFLIYPEAIYGQKWKKSIFQLLPGNQDFARVFLTVALKYSRKCRLFVTNNNYVCTSYHFESYNVYPLFCKRSHVFFSSGIATFFFFITDKHFSIVF